MGRKNVVKSFNMFNAASLAADATSEITDVINLDKASIHITWTGTSPVGDILVQARNGELDAWYQLDFGSTISVSGNTGEHQLVFNELPFTHIRLFYDRTSGTGSITAKISAKVQGA